MTFIVETGAGIPNANAYATVAFVLSYLTDRGRQTENTWSSRTSTVQQQAIVIATSYIDKRYGPRVKGLRRRTIIDGREASGTLTLTTLPALTETVTVGAVAYRFVDSLVAENDVLRGASITESAANLAAAIASGGDGVTSHAMTIQNWEASATAAVGVVTVTATVEGLSGNAITFATTVTGATATGSGFLASGLDEGPQSLIFPRQGLYGFDGQLIVGIPLKLKFATAEYAVRSLAGTLDPDPTYDATGGTVQRKREKVGPIEEETEYAAGGAIRIYADYPAADRLLVEYLTSGSGVYR